jgi:hypothetical protein
MKNSFTLMAMAWLPILVVTSPCAAQTQQNEHKQSVEASSYRDPNSGGYSYDENGRNFTSNVPINEISIHAYRHFRKNFPGSLDETWTKTAERLSVSFHMAGSRVQALYDVKGEFLFSLTYCSSGSQMDREIKQRVARFFPGYSTSVAVEVSDGNKTFQIVTIHNRQWVKTIQILDGEIKITDVLVNGGA